ncbi:MAG: MFS transporter [Chloroflexi bacterium]|nr:MFS transporter [Chloroflexota bacterium]
MSPTPATRHPPPARFRFQLIAATFARVVVNTAHRMVYPFLPAFSRGLGVPLESLAVILSVRGALGMASPFFGGVPDRFGRRYAMLIGVAIFCAALALVGLWPSYLTFFAAIILIVVSKFLFDPALQAYIGDRTPYSQRGLVIGITELGWSGAALVGIPLAGLLIARGTWRSPFLPLAGLGLLAGVALWFLIPRQPPTTDDTNAPRPDVWSSVWRNTNVLAALSLGLLITAGNESLNVVYGAWMERTYGLTVAALGLSVTVIGIAELAAEGLVIFLSDRLGKRRAVAAGIAAGTLAYFALPALTFDLKFALIGLFLVFITFEFTIVTSIPLMTELVPEARGTVMSANIAAHAGGRMLGALIGAYVFHFGFLWNGVAAAVLNLVALGLVVWVVRERKGK